MVRAACSEDEGRMGEDLTPLVFALFDGSSSSIPNWCAVRVKLRGALEVANSCCIGLGGEGRTREVGREGGLLYAINEIMGVIHENTHTRKPARSGLHLRVV